MPASQMHYTVGAYIALRQVVLLVPGQLLQLQSQARRCCSPDDLSTVAGANLACLPSLQDRKFYAHRIALLASSECFRAMFDGHYKEKQASVIPIPNIRFAVFERMMRCIYTGARVTLSVPLSMHKHMRGCTVLLHSSHLI